MPQLFRRAALVGIALAVSALANAQTPDPQDKPEPVANSEMDAQQFYQLLLGEVELRNGEPGVAFQLLLDAARSSGDDALYQRVIGIALRARAGDQALQAARAWTESNPKSEEAQQAVLQLLVLLNRPADTAAPLRALLALRPEMQRAGLLATLPRMFARSPDPKTVLSTLAPVLREQTKEPASAPTQTMALLVLGRLAALAGEGQQALAFAQRAAQITPSSDEPVLLALDLMGSVPDAENFVKEQLQAAPERNDLRMAYARTLGRLQRLPEAGEEFRRITVAAPDTALAWYGLGAVELELQHPQEAEVALKEFLKRTPASASANADAEKPEDGKQANDPRQQALLLLAQSAEIRKDYRAADAWLAQIAGDSLEIQYRRASLLARQGKLDQARKLLRELPETGDVTARGKLLAEAQLLREADKWELAYAVLETGVKTFPTDVDLIYEQAMMAEKLGHVEAMEAQLKQVIELKPDYYNAYNALGYSLADRNVRLPEARELIAKALSYAPNEPFIIDSLGWVEYRLGHKDEALRLLRQAYQAQPDPDVAAHLGEVLWVSAQQDEAKRVWAEGLMRDPKNDAVREAEARLIKP